MCTSSNAWLFVPMQVCLPRQNSILIGSVVFRRTQHTHTHTHQFNGPLSGTTQVSRYQKGETNLDFTEAIDRELQWHQLGHMQICTSLQRDNHANTSLLIFLQTGCPPCRPTNSVKALKAHSQDSIMHNKRTETFAFSASTLRVGRQEEHPACKNSVMRSWCGYLSGARCRLFAYGPADATASQNPIISCHLFSSL